MIFSRLLFASLAALAPSASMGLDYEVDGSELYLEGEIFSDDLSQMRQVLQDNRGLQTVVLVDVPGSNDDETNVQIIRLFREAGLNTHLMSDSFVASGGTDLFLSGVSRTMEKGAQIGVHSWSDGTHEGKDFPKSSGEHTLFLELYADLGINADFYWFTLEAAPADDMHFMTDTEIERYGLLTAPIGTMP